MWILSFIPDMVFHLVLVISILTFLATEFLSNIPVISQYARPAKFISIVLIVLSVFTEGALYNQSIWENKVASLEHKVLEAQVKSADANAQLTLKIKENELLRKEKNYATQNAIVKIITKTDDSQCKLSNAFIGMHDSASRDEVPDSTNIPNGDPSNVKPSEVLTTVVNNYQTCYNIRDKLIGWQEWYKTQKQIYDSVK